MTKPALTLSTRARAIALLENLTVGLPFCVFKVLTGMLLIHAGTALPVAWALIALGLFDAALNTVNAVTIALFARRVVPICCLTLGFRRSARADELGTALDTALSFALVATLIGSGWLVRLGPWLGLWNVAVVLNVIGAGAMRLEQAFARDSSTPTSGLTRPGQ